MRRPIAGVLAIAVLVAVFGASVALGAVRVGAPPSERGMLVSVAKRTAEVRAAERETNTAAPSDRLSWPLRGAITGDFGEGRGGHTHAGIDIPMPAGTPIKAASAGRVISAGPEDGYGNYVCIAHVKVSTCYAHLQTTRAKAGAKVGRGELIGSVGDTGTSSTTHLHFEVRRGTQQWGAPVDPLDHLPRA